MSGITQSTSSVRSLMTGLLAEVGLEVNGPKPEDPQIHDSRLFKRVVQEGSLGLGEAYMDGWWDCDALDQFFSKVIGGQIDRHISNMDRVRLGAQIFLERLQNKMFNFQSKKRAFIVGEQHYDIGNDLYEIMLDPTMSYTCAYWNNAKDLEEAQKNKLELVCQKLQLKPGLKLLDIGCGFGGMAHYAAKNYGVEVVGVTISKEQQKLAQERCKDLPIEIRLQDYRDLAGQFDRIVSIGMFEHVGPKNYDTYMSVARDVLKEDGLFLLHTIGSNFSMHKSNAWINKYIFPNGVLPSIAQIGDSIEDKFVMEDWHNFGESYYQTLKAWYEHFNKGYEKIKNRYSDRFYRMWRYYLLSCAGAFHARDCQLWQIVLSPQGVKGGYRSIR